VVLQPFVRRSACCQGRAGRLSLTHQNASLTLQKGQLVETIEGVNTPVLERMVQDNAPSKDELAASTDDPDSADEEDATTSGGGGGGKRRASLSVGLGRRRSVQLYDAC
jgi:hypothetical protein